MGKEIVFLLILVSLLAINYRRDLWEIALWLEDEYFPLKDSPIFPLGVSLIKTSHGLGLPGLNVSLIKCFDRSWEYPVLGEGWSKRVYAFHDFALKTPHPNGHSMRLCQQKFDNKIDSKEICQLQLRESFLREVLWLKRLENDANVPKLFSYCAEPDNYSILIERGQPVTTLSLLSVNLSQRIAIARQIIHFLLRNSAIDFRDFRRQQFVLNAKLVPLFVDFDDVVERGKNSDNTKTLTQIYRSMIYEFLAVGANETQLATLRDLDQVHERGQLSVHLLDEFLRKL